MKEHKTDMNITKIDRYKEKTKKQNSNSTTEHQTLNITKYKQLNITEHKTDMNITKKLNSTSTVEYGTTMNITEKLSSSFTKEY